MRRLALLACTAATVTALGTVAEPAVAHSSPAAHLSPASPVGEHAWLRGEVQSMTSMSGGYFSGLSRAAASAAQLPVQSYYYDELIPAGRLAGGKDVDVLDLQQSDADPTSARSLGIALRHGRTGSLIWRISFPESSQSATSVLVARVGPKHVPGIIVTNADQYFDGSGQVYILSVNAYSGATGKNLWGMAVNGSSTGSLVTNEPTLGGELHAASGPDDDLLFSTRTGDNSTGDYTMQPWLMAGTNGAQTKIGSSFPSNGGPGLVTPAPDLNGDGLADVMVTSQGDPGYTEAETATGHRIWRSTNDNLPDSDTVTSLGAFSHAAYPDLLFMTEGLGNSNYYEVVNGRTGHVEFSPVANEVYPIGVIGKHKQRAVGVLTFIDTATNGTVKVTADWRARAGNGTTIYHHSRSVAVKEPAGFTSYSQGGDVNFTGDLQADGANEQGLTISAGVSTPTATLTRTTTGFIGGRTGGFTTSPAIEVSDGSLTKGAADDLLLATESKTGQVVLTAWRGSDRHKYYSHTVAHLGVTTNVTIAGLRVSGSGCSDIAVAATNNAGANGPGILSVLSGRGQPLWLISFGGTNRADGTLHRYPAPKHLCE